MKKCSSCKTEKEESCFHKNNFKKDGLASECKECKKIVLEFDHISNKNESISIMVKNRRPIETIQQEIDKCEVRCSNYHKRKTAKDFGWYKNKIILSHLD